ANPNIPIGIQTDFGSHENTVRSSQWIDDFDSTATDIGYSTYTGFEYAISGKMYNSLPKPLVAERLANGSIMISFNKRIDEQTASQVGNYSFKVNGVTTSVNITHIRVDGNRAFLQATNFPTGTFEILVSNIK